MVSKRKHKILFEKYKGICQLCKKPCNFQNSNADHIIPKSKGGGNNVDNLQLTHIVCNCIKGSSLLYFEPEYYINNKLYGLIKLSN